MKRRLMAGLAFALSSQIAYADLMALTGTAQMYAPDGSAVMMPMPITGDYDTATRHVTIHPWLFFGVNVYSDIGLLDPGVHTRPGAGSVTVNAGQLGGFIQTDWGANVDLPAFLVWDVVNYPGGTHFEPVDSDGDGILGHAMLSGPFPGFSIVYEFDVGEPAPDVDVSLNVDGGNSQECNALGGKTVSFSAAIDLSGGAELGSVTWTVDGEDAGSGNTLASFLGLGSHTVQVTATTTQGLRDSASAVVNVVDTVRPNLAISFVDSRTGQPMTSVAGAAVSFLEVRLAGTDVCDGDVDVMGVAKPVYAIVGGEVIKIQGKNQDVDMPTTAIEVSATAVDDSGNKQIDQAVLPIAP